ncbi:MAG: TRAP-type C4-dicarboxylate transport system substrate-binding protein, partial [Thalassolituus oleivorans]
MRAALLFLLAMTGCQAATDVTVIKLAHGLDASHPVHKSMVFMADTLAAMSSGSMRIDI